MVAGRENARLSPLAPAALLAALLAAPLLLTAVGLRAGAEADAPPRAGAHREHGERAHDADGWRSPESWRRLRVGMSRWEVLRILGEPGKTTRYYAFERWEYPDALGRRVNFDERGRLVAWGAWAR